MKFTLFKYLFKMQTKAMILSSLFFFALIVVFNFAEVSRRMEIATYNDFLNCVLLSSLWALKIFEEIIHYIYFIVATFCIWHLCRSHQLTILKSSGQSPLQILHPFMAFAVATASIWIFVLHPLGIYGDDFYKKAFTETSENISIEGNANIWIDHYKNNDLIFIKKLYQGHAHDVYIFNEKNDKKLIADSADFGKSIVLHNGVKIEDGSVRSFEKYKYENDIDRNLQKLLFRMPSSQPIYSLYNVYKIGHQSMMILKSYEIELQRLIVKYFAFLLFVLIAATICFPINRYQSKTNIVVKMILAAIVLRFLNNIFAALAQTNVLPVMQAMWGPTLIIASISMALLIWREV